MRLKKIGLVAALALSASLVTTGAAFATTASPENAGDTWNYETNIFVTGGQVYSNYYHPGRTHGSTSVNGQGFVDRSPDRPAGTWSYASNTGTWWGNSAYYR